MRSTASDGWRSTVQPCALTLGRTAIIDLLVEFEPARIPGLLGVAGMEITLSELFAGRKVDLRTAEDLSPYFRQEVLNMAEVQYERA